MCLGIVSEEEFEDETMTMTIRSLGARNCVDKGKGRA